MPNLAPLGLSPNEIATELFVVIGRPLWCRWARSDDSLNKVKWRL
jgi:hypothetical protein